MTESQIERRTDILYKLFSSKKDRDNYNIQFFDSFIDIRNKKTLDGIYTDSLQNAKKWIIEDLKNRKHKMDKYKWNIVHECDLDDGTPTEWALKVSEEKFYWIDKLSNESFNIIDSNCHTVLANCKSLSSAKRWVTTNLL